MKIEKLGRYEIQAELGQGAMGVVYKATDPLIDRTVAIKTINLNLTKDELADFEERFDREAKSAGRLNHPNIVTIYDVGHADHIAFMAMEYLDGRELKDIIASGEVLPHDRIAEIIAQVADGLAFAHDHGVVHRDIKPANIMVLRNGSVKITDFGIAKMSSSSRTQVGIVLGSPRYMSPEQVIGKAVDGRSDIFSLGAVLYELLAGESAFGGENDTLTSIMYRIMNETPAAPSSRNAAIPKAFDYIVARALAKEPENRYQSAREMANDLRQFQSLAVDTAPFSAASTGNRLPTAGNDDVTQVMDALRMESPSFRSSGKKLAAAAATLLLIIATVFFTTTAKKPDIPAIPAEQQRASTTPASTPASEMPQPPAAAESRSPPAKPQAGEKPVPASTSQGNLTFTVLPWGEVFIDDKRLGASPPLKEVSLAAGKHQIEIRNADFPPYRENINLEAGQSKKIQHTFK